MFLVWFLPAILYAILTRWQPYYVLSYILGHLAYGLYFFPKWGSYSEAEGATIAIWLGLAIVNGTLFVLFEKGRLHSPFLKWVTFQATICIFIIVSISRIRSRHYGIWMNVPLIASACGSVYCMPIKTQNKVYLLFAGLWVSAAITVKYIEIIIEYHNELFFIVSLLFVIVFIGANVMFMNYVRAWQPASEKTEETELDRSENASDRITKGWRFHQMGRSCTYDFRDHYRFFLGSFTLIGLVTVVLGFDDPANILIGYGFVSRHCDVSCEKIQYLSSLYDFD